MPQKKSARIKKIQDAAESARNSQVKPETPPKRKAKSQKVKKDRASSQKKAKKDTISPDEQPYNQRNAISPLKQIEEEDPSKVQGSSQKKSAISVEESKVIDPSASPKKIEPKIKKQVTINTDQESSLQLRPSADEDQEMEVSDHDNRLNESVES